MNAIYKFVMATLAKRGGKTGLTTIQRGKGLNVELSVKQIEQTLKNMGVDISKIKSSKEVEKYLNIQQSWLKQQPKGPMIGEHRVIDATSSEGKGITEALFGKKPADVLDLTGKKIDTSKPILGGKNVELTHNEKIDWLVKNVDPKAEQTIPPKATLEAMLKDGRDDLIDHFFEMHTKKLSGKPQINIDTSDLKHPELVKKMMTDEKLKPTLVQGDIVADTIATIKSKKPIEAMAEANSVIGRKGKYKNLTEKQSKKILKDTEDHIFERDIKPDPEDLAEGGVAGLLGETNRVPYRRGSRQPGFETATSKKKQEKQQQDIRDLQKQMADVSWDDHARDYVTQHTLNEFQKQTAPRLPKIPKPPSEPPLRGRRRPPPWFRPEFQKRRYLYQKEEDLPEGILELLKKDPNFDLETFLNIGWSMPENVWDKGAKGLRGVYYNKEGPTGIDVPVQSRGEPPGEKIWNPYDAEFISDARPSGPLVDYGLSIDYATPSGGPTERIWDPDKLNYPTSRTFSEGFFGPSLEGEIDLQMRPFKEDDSPIIRNPNEPTSYTDEHRMSNMDKARVALHEMRHKKYVENPVLWKSQPEWVQNVEMPGTLESEQFGGQYRAGHELYNRFLDQRYFPPTRDIDDPPGEPYFDKILKDLWEPSAKEYEKIINEYDLSPVNKAGGGIAGMLGEPTYADGGRVPLGGGKLVFDAARRKFLQMMGGAAAGTAAAKTGLFGLLKASKPSVIKELTSVPIGNASGMPVWFKPLVNKVIKEGDDVTKKFATKDREIVHAKQLDNGDYVYLHQELDTGIVRVEYQGKGTFGESPTQLQYKPGEIIETGSKKGKKTNDEFTAMEDDFYPQATSPDGDFDIEFTENIVNKVDDLYSDTSKLKEFATGKKLTIKEISESMKKKNYIKEVEKNPNDHAFRNAPDYDGPYEDFASGGRVPLRGGKWVLEGLMSLFKKTPTTLKEFIEKRQFLKNMMGNTPENEKKRILAKILAENKKVKGYEFPDLAKRRKDIMGDEGKAAKDFEMRLQEILAKHSTKHASGGRVPMIFGGGIYKTIIKNLAKDQGVNPSYYLKVTNYKSLPKDAKKYISKVDYEKMREGRVAMFENLVEMAKSRQRFEASVKAGKEGSPHAAPIFEHLEKSFKSPVPHGVTDEQIMVGEQILKNLKTKGRKLNATGGLAGMLGE